MGAEDGIVVDTPCEDSSTWGVDVPSRVYDDAPLSAEADPNGESSEQSTTQPSDPSTSSLHHITEISTFKSHILGERTRQLLTDMEDGMDGLTILNIKADLFHHNMKCLS